MVNALEARRLPRGLTILGLYPLNLGTILGLIIASVPPLVGLVLDFLEGDTLRTELERFTRWLAFFGWDTFHIVPPVFTLPDTVTQLLDQAQTTVEREALPALRSAGLILGDFLGLPLASRSST